MPGIGPITATALVASVDDAKTFDNSRQLAAWLGLVPRRHLSEGKPMLLGISKRGDTHPRTLLILGARAIVRVAEGRKNIERRLKRPLERRHKNVAAVVLANCNARIVWTLLSHGRT